MVLLRLDPRKIETRGGKIIFTRKNLELLEEFPKGPLIELIQGEIFLLRSQNPRHQEIAANLNFKLRNYLQDFKETTEGTLLNAPIDLVLSEENMVIPDLVFIKKSKEHIIKEKWIEGVPNLVIEVLSEERDRDLVYKKNMYEAFGVQEYWIIDPTIESVDV